MNKIKSPKTKKLSQVKAGSKFTRNTEGLRRQTNTEVSPPFADPERKMIFGNTNKQTPKQQNNFLSPKRSVKLP